MPNPASYVCTATVDQNNATGYVVKTGGINLLTELLTLTQRGQTHGPCAAD